MNQSNHTPPQPNFEAKIEAFLSGYRQKYRYPGEPGQQYHTIYGILSQLNSVPFISNIHLRWYASTYELIGLYFVWRMSEPGIPRMLNEAGANMLDSATFIRPGGPVAPVPPFIEDVETFLYDVIRFGILFSTGCQPDDAYMHQQIKSWIRHLERLLTQAAPPATTSPDTDVYILTFHAACTHTQKLMALFQPRYLSAVADRLKKVDFRQHVAARQTRVSTERERQLQNISDFWNGFLP